MPDMQSPASAGGDYFRALVKLSLARGRPASIRDIAALYLVAPSTVHARIKIYLGDHTCPAFWPHEGGCPFMRSCKGGRPPKSREGNK